LFQRDGHPDPGAFTFIAGYVKLTVQKVYPLSNSEEAERIFIEYFIGNNTPAIVENFQNHLLCIHLQVDLHLFGA